MFKKIIENKDVILDGNPNDTIVLNVNSCIKMVSKTEMLTIVLMII